MSASKLLESVRNWNVFDLPAYAATIVAEMTEEQERDVIAMLVPAADRCPVEGRLSTMPNFMPRGNVYNNTGCEAFQEPGWLISRRGAAAALPVLRDLFHHHASREVRLAAGQFMLAYAGTAAEVAEGAVERAKDLVGWFNLWAVAQVAISPAEAYVAVADRIATTADPKPLLAVAVDVST